MIGREELLGSDGIKWIRGIVLGKGIRTHPKPKQALDAVDVLPSVEPSHRHFPTLVRKLSSRILELVGQLGQEACQFFFGRLLFILRRHVTRIERIEYVLPMSGYGIVRQLQRQFIQAKLSLLFFRAMTTEAVFGEEWLCLFFRQGNNLLGTQRKWQPCQ